MGKPIRMKMLLRMLGITVAIMMIGLHIVVMVTTDVISMTSHAMFRISVNITYFEYTNEDTFSGHRDQEPNTNPAKIPGLWRSNRSLPWKYSSDDTPVGTPVIGGNSTVTSSDSYDPSLFLVVVVFSSVEHFYHRDVIRRTWASVKPSSASVVFVIGLPSANDIGELLDRELKTYRDLLLVDVKDSYTHLTMKSIATLRWLTVHCPNLKYVIKVDDDTTVNIPHLLDSLYHVPYSYFIMGDIIAGAQPMRDVHSKWYTPPEVYPVSTYPEYISGAAYVISGDLIRDLFWITQKVPYFWLEDVFITGMCAAKLNVSLVHNHKFKFISSIPSDPCMFSRYITIHRIQPETLSILWQRYLDKCDRTSK